MAQAAEDKWGTLLLVNWSTLSWDCLLWAALQPHVLPFRLCHGGRAEGLDSFK